MRRSRLPWMALAIALLLAGALAACVMAPTPTPRPPLPGPEAAPTLSPISATLPVRPPVEQPLRLTPPTYENKCNSSLAVSPGRFVNPVKALDTYRPDDIAAAKAELPPIQYVRGQLLLTALAQDLDTLTTRRSELGLTWNPETDRITPPDRYSLETRLYHLDARGPADTFAALEAVRQAAAAEKLFVLVDLNYVVSSPQGSQALKCGLSESLHGEGSPFEAESLHGEGSPLFGGAVSLHGEGSPFDLPAGQTAADAFCGQWGLGDPKGGGINLMIGCQRRPVGSGEKARIVILDTSPFTVPGQWTFAGKDWTSPPLSLCVEHPVQTLLTQDFPECKTAPDVRSHGLFVSGLAQVVAPGSDIHLVRVLDEHGQGDLAGVLFALARLDPGLLSQTVVNLSLGFRPIGPAVTGMQARAKVCAMLDKNYGIQDCSVAGLAKSYTQITDKADRLALLDSFDAADLEMQVEDLQQRALVTAAAGNRSRSGNPLPPQLPAAYAAQFPGRVLDVAASTDSGSPAFYTQIGTVGAPGGGDNRAGCDPRGVALPGTSLLVPACWRYPGAWMIGPLLLKDQAGSPYWSYGVWVGSSFATPLVSGMLAVELSNGGVRAPGTPAPSADPGVSVCRPSPVTPPSPLGAGIAGFCP
jgi:hypothetical protein